MNEIPPDLHYTKSHEWVRHDDDGTVVIGITDYAQQSLGDITYVQLPRPGAALTAGAPFGVIESVKAASDLYGPVSGTVVAVNDSLATAPDTVNRAPYTDGWLLRVAPEGDPLELMSPEFYRALTG